MASNPPFEMEDQTDEDFFDKLVNDDDDDFVPPKPVTQTGSGVVSAFSNLSIEGSAGKSDLSVKGENDSVDSGVGKGDASSPVVENKALESASSCDFNIMTKSGLGANAVTESSVGEKGFDLDKGLGNAEGGSGLGDEAGGESSVLEPMNSFDFNTGVELNGSGLMGLVEASSGLLDKAGEESSVLPSANSFEFNTGVELKGSGSEGSMGSVGFSGASKQVDWSSFHGFGSDSDFFSNLGNGGEEFPVQEKDLDSQVNVMSSLGIASTGMENSVYDGSYQEQQGYGTGNPANFISTSMGFTSPGLENSVYDGQHQEQQGYGTGNEQSINAQDWENMYPGWKYDYNTGQWYQVENYDPSSNAQDRSNANVNLQESANNFLSAGWPAASSDGQSEVGVSYLQQTAQSAAGTVSETGTTESVSNWNQFLEVNNGYPEHIIFDPQYPGWYYDSIAQEWQTMDSYVPSVQQTSQYHDHQNQKESSTSSALQSSMYGDFREVNYGSQDPASQSQGSQWTGSYGEHNQYNMTSVWQHGTTAANSNAIQDLGQQLNTSYGSEISSKNHVDQFKSFNSSAAVPSYGKQVQDHAEVNGTFGMQPLVPSQPFNHANVSQNQHMHNSNSFYQSQNTGLYPQQSFQSGKQFPHNPTQGRSSEGRPPHPLVTFGFGGKLIVMKDTNSLSSSMYGNQGSTGASISVLNLMEVVQGSNDATGDGVVACDYFRALCQQAFPGPLVGGNVGNKDLNKWIDDRITNCESSDMYYNNKRANLKLLLSLLKLACQHYGKLRSPFGTDTLLKEGDNPETAVAKLFASAKDRKEAYGPVGRSHCLQSLPSTEQVQAIASEVQKLLVSGRKMEALKYAQEGQLWGPALVLASQLGDQFYVDTVKQMALHQLVPGSPLRTLCLLIAGQPAEVFSADTDTVGGIPGSQNMPEHTQQLRANGMLDDWEENLAVIAANRTKDDELVIIHLGDNLWKERSDITAAHICYLVAEANFESYSDSARLCLVGADHWKSPRTFASPDSIQRTELYEYAKVLGNSQFILLPFQPYKLIYAYMLAEVGKVSDSLKYCQALTKSLKTGRAPEVEMWKQAVLSLEERIRTHQQGGYSANLAPAKLVGKLLNFFDNTAHKVVGGLPPPAPATSQASTQGNNEQFLPPLVPKVSGSQSTMAMSSLIPSASMEPISEWTADNNKMTFHNRSVSEPDFGRSPRQVASSNEGTGSQQDKASISGRSSGLGRFFQRTVGLVLRPRNDKQAKLGEKNKFYYDEKLKRWVEEGAEPPAEEAVLPPPPTTKAFQNGMPDYNLKSALKNEGFVANGSPEFSSPTPSDSLSGMPPIPPSSNQFSARGRMGVRSRYVDTFNKSGGSPANLFQTPSVPAVKPAVAGTPKFFVPFPAAPGEQTMETISESVQEDTPANENPPASTSMSDRFQSSVPASSSSSSSMQRFPSMDNIPSKGTRTNENGPLSSHSRRTASWSGSFNDAFSPPKNPDIKPLGEALGMSPPFMQSDAASMRMSASGGSLVDDLHEVEL